MSSIIFKEEQKFKFLFVKIIFALLFLLLLWGIYSQMVLDKPVGSKPAPNGVLIGAAIVPLLFLFLFSRIKLTTTITKETIKIHFSPFAKKEIKWSEISQAHIREYNSLKEFKGYGVRVSKTAGKAYNISGNQGLQIELNDGSKVLIGTQEPEKVKTHLQQNFSDKSPS
jgi:hypothetical protein